MRPAACPASSRSCWSWSRSWPPGTPGTASTAGRTARWTPRTPAPATAPSPRAGSRRRFALSLTVANAAALLLAAYLLNPLAFVLAPVALAILLGYSYSKRVTSFTTPFLGLVEAIIPAAVYIAVRGVLPPVVLLAVGGLLAWGTAFETVHSLGDIDSDRALGLFSLPQRLGARASLQLVAVLHGVALVLLAVFGIVLGLSAPYYAGLAVMAIVAAISDVRLAREPTKVRIPFERHFVMAFAFLVGVLVAVFVPALGAAPGGALGVLAPPT